MVGTKAGWALVPCLLAVLAGTASAQDGNGSVAISGELRRWHKVTLTLDGPFASETGTPNPFLDYRMDVTFTNGSLTYLVPGYFAADGNAANTSATSGIKWRAHLSPDLTGTWTYTITFKSGSNVAVNGGGSNVAPYHGTTGSFTVSQTNKSGIDLRGKGRLQYVGKHHQRFAGNGEYFLKQGADAPENFLAYQDFDGPFKNDGQGDQYIKTWSAHVGDWNTGDPTWQGGKGKGIIGAVNYLASEGLNAFSFLPMNIAGDDRNVFPYLNYNERNRIDVSRVAQWEIVFEHGTRKGMYLHFKTQETENELLLNSGNMGVQRKLYYRELIARFSHHLALNWNLGEEINNATTSQKQAWAQYFWDNDPYRHNIVIHNGSNHYDLLGSASRLTGFSLQTSNTNFSQVHTRVLNYLTRSANAGKPWVVACDEPGDASAALRPDSNPGNSHVDGRKNGIWGTFMAGGAGNEWYFGYQYAHSDLTCQDWRSRNAFWDYCRYALQFFKNNNIPFWDMTNDNTLSSNTNDYCFTKGGEVYVVYLKSGGTTNLNLTGISGTFDVKWFDPRNGGGLQNGSVAQVSGGGSRSLGNAPNSGGSDWAILVTLSSSTPTYSLTVSSGSGDGNYAAGSVVSISADPPPAGQVFDQWTGNTGVVGDIFSASTTVTMPASSVTVTATYKPGSGSGQSVGSLTLINADTNTDIGPLQDGNTLNLATLPTTNLNVRANTNPATVGSVRFGYDSNPNYRTESVAPYALEGDSGGNYNPWTPTVGSHTITATPFTQSGGGGTAGTALTVNFSVINSVSLPDVDVQVPDAQASETGPDPGSFTISRSGGTSGTLNVQFTLTGSASGSDYTASSGSPVTIGSGQSSVTVTITPVDDGAVEGDETVILTIQSNAAYNVGTPSSGTVTISDNDSPPPPDQDPSVSFTNPSNLAMLSGTVAVNATASDPDVGGNDGDGIANVLFELLQGTTVVDSAQQNAAPYNWNLDTTQHPNGTYTLRATATATVAAGGSSSSTSITVTIANSSGGALPAPWLNQDVGAVGAAGSAVFVSGAFTVDASGADIWGTADEFHYVYQPLTGDGEIVVRVASLTNTDPWAKAGVMIRETLAADSAHASVFISPGNGAAFQRRTLTAGTSVTTAGGAVSAPYYVRLVRRGNTFYSFISSDGQNWTAIGSDTVVMGATVQIGMAVTSHNDGVLTAGTFDGVFVDLGTDSDGDGMSDASETLLGYDPFNGDQDGNGTRDGQDDWDSDGTINQDEVTNGTFPGIPPGGGGGPPGGGGGGSGGGCGATGAEVLLLLALAALRRKRNRS